MSSKSSLIKSYRELYLTNPVEVVTDLSRIKELLESKASACWGCQGAIPNTNAYVLAHFSPESDGQRGLVLICSQDDARKAQEEKLSP